MLKYKAKPGPKTEELGDTYTAQLLAARTGESLGEQAKIYRDAFAIEYVKDFNGPQALARIGVSGTKQQLLSRTSNLLREPYVAGRIDALVRQLKPEDVVTRQQVMARMWQEANDPGNPGKVRVSALAHVATMLGMTRPKEDTGNTPVGVMFIPMVADDDWSMMAQASQKALKAGTTVDVEAQVTPQ